MSSYIVRSMFPLWVGILVSINAHRTSFNYRLVDGFSGDPISFTYWFICMCAPLLIILYMCIKPRSFWYRWWQFVTGLGIGCVFAALYLPSFADVRPLQHLLDSARFVFAHALIMPATCFGIAVLINQSQLKQRALERRDVSENFDLPPELKN